MENDVLPDLGKVQSALVDNLHGELFSLSLFCPLLFLPLCVNEASTTAKEYGPLT